MNTIRLRFSATLVVVGAVLAWATTYEPPFIDLNRTGLIIFFTGLALAGYRLIGAAIDQWFPASRRRGNVVAGPRSTSSRSDSAA